MGEETYQIFMTLADTGEANDFKKATDQLTKYFQPKKNIELEKYAFRQTTQKEGVTLDEYHTKLRNLAQTCEFNKKERRNQKPNYFRIQFKTYPS